MPMQVSVFDFELNARNQCTEGRFASFLSSVFITVIAVNPLERKLAKRTSVDWVNHGHLHEKDFRVKNLSEK